MSIGEALVAARRHAGLTVAQVSQQTRIRQTIIRSIENDDYAACGGDFYARGHIRSIAKAVGADPAPLILEYDTTQRAPQGVMATDALYPVTPARRATPVTPARPVTPAHASQPVGPAGTHGRRRLQQALALAIVVAIGFVVYDFVWSSNHATTAVPQAGAHPLAQPHTGHSARSQPRNTAQPASGPPTSAATARAAPAVALTPVSATAIGSPGDDQGDNPQLAPLAIDGSRATAWHTDWYTTARFGNLYPGTGLLLDMGRAVAITGARVTLGSAPGTDFQLRAGATPAVADLPPVAGAASAGGEVQLRLTIPAHGRYVLIWFTRLPPDPAGTFRASVSDVSLAGHA